MAIAGLFSVLAWNAVMPDRRDALVLGPLPVSTGVICRAKIAALLTSLAVSVAAVNAFTGLAYPVVLSPSGGFFGLLRSLAAYWITMAAAGLFICGALLAVQGIAAQAFSYRRFQRASSFLQLAAFFVILGAYFLKPPLATLAGLTAPSHRRLLEWIPTYWFLGLFQELNGPMHPVFAPLAVRALWALALVLAVAALTYVLAYQRGLRRIVEQPDIAPGDRSRAASGVARFLAAKTAIEASRPRHRVVHGAHHRAQPAASADSGGVCRNRALAIALAYLKSLSLRHGKGLGRRCLG